MCQFGSVASDHLGSWLDFCSRLSAGISFTQLQYFPSFVTDKLWGFWKLLHGVCVCVRLISITMRLWRLHMVTAALVVASTMPSAHDTFVYERQQQPAPSVTVPTPVPLSTTTLPSSTPVVVSTIFIPDARPRPTDSPARSSGSVRSSTSLIAIVISTPPKQETPSANPQSSDQTNSITATTSNNNNNTDSLITGAVSFNQRDVVPTIVPDAPATAFFLVLFLAGTVFYALRVYNSLSNSPALSAIILTFCILRVIACALRIAWAVLPQNEGLQISEMVSLNVG